MLKVSSGFKNRILGQEGFVDIFDRGAILVYSGTRPDTADDPPTGMLLGKVTIGGYPWNPPGDTGFGLRFLLSGPRVAQPFAAGWALRVEAPGTASWARLVGPELDPGVLSRVLPRIDFDVTDTPNDGKEFVLSSTDLLPGQEITIDAFMYTIPPML